MKDDLLERTASCRKACVYPESKKLKSTGYFYQYGNVIHVPSAIISEK